MLTTVCVVGITVTSSWLEKRFADNGNMLAAKAAKSFSKWFLLGAVACIGWYAYLGMVALITV